MYFKRFGSWEYCPISKNKHIFWILYWKCISKDFDRGTIVQFRRISSIFSENAFFKNSCFCFQLKVKVAVTFFILSNIITNRQYLPKTRSSIDSYNGTTKAVKSNEQSWRERNNSNENKKKLKCNSKVIVSKLNLQWPVT